MEFQKLKNLNNYADSDLIILMLLETTELIYMYIITQKYIILKTYYIY